MNDLDIVAVRIEDQNRAHETSVQGHPPAYQSIRQHLCRRAAGRTFAPFEARQASDIDGLFSKLHAHQSAPGPTQRSARRVTMNYAHRELYRLGYGREPRPRKSLHGCAAGGGCSESLRRCRDSTSIATTDKRLVPIKLDVTQDAEVNAAAAACTDVNLLINNAGIMLASQMLAVGSEAALRAEMEVNVFGMLRTVRAFAPLLARNGEGVRMQLKAQGTQLVAVYAGFIDTDMAAGFDREKTPPRQVAERTLAGIGLNDVHADERSEAIWRAVRTDPAQLHAQMQKE